MGLSPEEKQKIYEEEKARIEARERIEQERLRVTGSTSTGLKPNVAGLLCYLGGWVSGIILLLLEQKNRFVRFHAAQSIVVFGALTLAIIVFGWIPVVGGALTSIISVAGFIFWIILMVKAYNGERFKLPWAGDVAERMIAASGATDEYYEPPAAPPPSEESSSEAPSPPAAGSGGKTGDKVEAYFKSTRGGRITASSFAIAWSIVLLIFFNFFHQYIAYYHSETVDGVVRWIGYPILTGDINLWLPILTATLILTIIGHIILIIFDKHALREIIQIVLNVFGIATVVTLLSVFPFNFSVIPNPTAASATHVSVVIALIIISVGLAIGTLVRFIKLIVYAFKRSTSY